MGQPPQAVDLTSRQVAQPCDTPDLDAQGDDAQQCFADSDLRRTDLTQRLVTFAQGHDDCYGCGLDPFVPRGPVVIKLDAPRPGLGSCLKPPAKRTPRRPGQTLACGWCGSPILLPARGRVPKWCSSSCRHRAWELARAAASGHAAVEVVDRVIEVDKPVPVIEQVPVSPHGPAWTNALADLVIELDTGRVYDRDLPALANALGQVMNALDRRPGWP